MIQRIVLLKLVDDLAHRRGRRAVSRHAVKALSALPGVVGVTVGEAADDASAKSWDVSFSVFLEGPEAVEPYIVHPDHQAFVTQYLGPRVSFKKAWNFEVPDASIPEDRAAQLPSDR